MKNKEDILNELLELSEKHFNEGDYITASKLLKDIYNRNDKTETEYLLNDEFYETMSFRYYYGYIIYSGVFNLLYFIYHN